MTKDELIRSLSTARAEGRIPSAPYADLWGANLWGANLRGANLRGADLWGAIHPHILPIGAGRSGDGAFYPTPEGWRVSIGCWKHKTIEEFDQLLSDEIEWPGARGEERDRRRPLLQAYRTLFGEWAKTLPPDLIETYQAEAEKVRAEQEASR